MSFETQFRLFSYAVVFCGFLSLWVSGSFGLLETAVFILILGTAWRLESSRWQIGERFGTVLIVLAIPVYYFLWRFRFLELNNPEVMLPGILARLILSLTAIKLLQRKSDRDWVFLYLMSFFEVLLGAGLSISIGYILSFAAYVMSMASAIILFEVRRSERNTNEKLNPQLSSSGSTGSIPLWRVIVTASILMVFVALLAVPMFFVVPRVGGAGIGGNLGGVSTYSGFSDTVRLGGIGRIQQNDEVVMRVRIEGDAPESIRWRGVSLDTFDGGSWSRTNAALKEPRTRNERGLIQVDTANRQDRLTIQTVYLEPLDTPVIFGLNRMVGIQGNFAFLFRDPHGSITFQRTGERISYKVLSDIESPLPIQLRKDRQPYPDEFATYLQLPAKLDHRVAELAANIIAGTADRYESAVAIESFLQDIYGYTLEQKAGGSDPLSDFLFNVREGHCEYFATAMAIMLRTQGIATRVVNGFQRGDYNETADVFVVRQRHAHSWVEVYFPETETWVEFDPTPFAGRNGENATAGFPSRLRNYLEALETFWIQYFVAFDNQEQRSLFVSVRRGISDYQNSISSAWNILQVEIFEWWKQVRGDSGFSGTMSAVGSALLTFGGIGILIFLIGWFIRKAIKSKVWRLLRDRLFGGQRETVVDFYQRMLSALALKGFERGPHQTPLEFAFEVGIFEVVKITDKYNRVRFGERELSETEADEVEDWLRVISETETQSPGG